MSSGTGSDNRFRLAVEASPAAMIMTGPDGLIEFANAETERMFHYTVEELIGRSIDELVPQRMRGAHAGLRRGFLASPSKRPMGAGRDLNGVRKDGMEFPVEIALTPIDSESGLIVLATVVDITARRRSETELAQRASELELANERLTQFAYVASHDLQEPLRKIAVYAGLLDEAIAKSDAADVARATSVIASSAVRARRLVDNLLTFSRVTGSETQLQPLDLRAEVELGAERLVGSNRGNRSSRPDRHSADRRASRPRPARTAHAEYRVQRNQISTSRARPQRSRSAQRSSIGRARTCRSPTTASASTRSSPRRSLSRSSAFTI